LGEDEVLQGKFATYLADFQCRDAAHP
jgi:hypothetical protein